MKKILILAVSATLIYSCENSNQDLYNLISNLKKINTIKTLSSTLYLDTSHYIIYDYLDTSDSTINLGNNFAQAGIFTEYILPPVQDSCYWNQKRCNGTNTINFLDQVKPVLCALWQEEKLYSTFANLNIKDFNYSFPYHKYPMCSRKFRDFTQYIQEEKEYKFFLWCIHDDSNCFIVIVPRFEYMEEKVLNCEDLLIVRAYE